MKKILWATFLLWASSLPAAGAGPADEAAGFAFSRGKPAAAIEVTGERAFLLRADRDIAALKIELRPAAGQPDPPGEMVWEAELFALPPTEELELPDTTRLTTSSRAWRARRTLGGERPFATTVQAQVPRSVYRNWLLLLKPQGDGAAELKIQATPVDEAARVRWLMAMRAAYDPFKESDQARALIRHLTDEEVRHWTGFLDRQVFLQVWLRMPLDRIDQEFQGPEAHRFWKVGQALPNGLRLHTTARF